VLAFLYLRMVWPRGSFLMLAWGAVVIFAIVYLAHHYVIDAIGGITYTLIAYLVVERLVHAGWPRDAVRWFTTRARPARSET
jgi:membrane-associated phospholipid phosphatase